MASSDTAVSTLSIEQAKYAVQFVLRKVKMFQYVTDSEFVHSNEMEKR